MSINLTDALRSKAANGKLADAEQIFLEGDSQNVQNEIKGINSRHDALSEKHKSLSVTVQSISATGKANTATEVTYNNTNSGITAENIQDAVDKLAAKDATKAEKEDVQASVSELKAKNTSQDAEIAKKANSADVTSLMQTEQTRVNTELAKKFNSENITLELGDSEDKVMSQKAVSTKLNDLSDKCKSFAENIIFGSKYNTEDNPIFSVSNYAIYGTDDIFKIGTGYAVTNKIPVSEGDKFYLRVDGLQEACAYVIYYDNGTYKKSKKTYFDGIITIDKGATHIRFGVSSRTSKLDLFKIHEMYLQNKGEAIERSSLFSSRNTNDNQIFSIDDTAIYGEGSDITPNLKGYKVSNKIPISRGDIFYMYVDNIGSAYAYCLYYADGTYRRFGKYAFDGLIKIEDEAQYIRFGCGTTGSICRLMKVYPGVLNFVNKSDILQELGESSDKIVSQKAINDAINELKNNIESIATKKFDIDNIILSKITSNSKVLAFGDSITYGVSSTSQYECGNIKDENEKSYKYIDVFTKKANIILTNMAVSGATATDNTVSNHDFMKNQIERAKTFSADYVLVAIGTNDYGVSEGDNLGSLKTNILDTSNAEYQTFYGALNSEIKLIKETWQNAKIFLITPIPRYNINNKSTKSLYWYRKAIYEIAVINQCSFINGEKLIFPSDNQYAGKGEIANILLADGLHPTSLGHKLMGEKLANLVQ